MSDVIQLKSTVSTDVKTYIQIPSYYKDKYSSYFGIVSADTAICICPNKKYPSTWFLNPEHLLNTYRTLDEPIDEMEFWRLYHEAQEAMQKLVTPHIPQP